MLQPVFLSQVPDVTEGKSSEWCGFCSGIDVAHRPSLSQLSSPPLAMGPARLGLTPASSSALPGAGPLLHRATSARPVPASRAHRTWKHLCGLGPQGLLHRVHFSSFPRGYWAGSPGGRGKADGPFPGRTSVEPAAPGSPAIWPLAGALPAPCFFPSHSRGCSQAGSQGQSGTNSFPYLLQCTQTGNQATVGKAHAQRQSPEEWRDRKQSGRRCP